MTWLRKNPLGRPWIVAALAAACWFSFLPVRGNEAGASSEYKVKAAFLLNFLKYVEWPAIRHSSTNSPLEIVHVGDNCFGPDLLALVRSKVIGGRTVMLKQSDDPTDWKAGHILFISDSEKGRLPEILEEVKGLPVLTVGESPGFIQQGGMINFCAKEKEVRLEISLVTAEATGLKISSRLLAVADEVKRN